MRTQSSSQAVTMCSLSGLKNADSTAWVCPLRSGSCPKVAFFMSAPINEDFEILLFQRFTLWSKELLKIIFDKFQLDMMAPDMFTLEKSDPPKSVCKLLSNVMLLAD